MGGRASDADAEEREAPEVKQCPHCEQRKHATREREGQGGQIASHQRAQEAAGDQDGEGLSRGEDTQSVDRDQIGQSQPQSGQGDQDGKRDKPLAHGDGEGQGGQHCAPGKPADGMIHDTRPS